MNRRDRDNPRNVGHEAKDNVDQPMVFRYLSERTHRFARLATHRPQIVGGTSSAGS
jgi:hypothetical protein